MLQVRDLDLFYGDAQALAGVAIDVPKGAIVAIVGSNGAGKSSLIRTIQGIERPRQGSIVFDGTDITGWPSHRICNLGIGHVAEGRQIFPSLTVDENLDIGAYIERGRAKKAATKARMFEMFPRLLERRNQYAGTMSGGEQQMLAIARCLMGQPSLILFDEPSLGLAPVIVQDVFQIIRRLHRDGHTIVLVEQNVAVSLTLASHAYVLENGRITLAGSGAQLLNDDRVRKAYLGM
jgi:branched-chain amino acid transport system ATP-binding protein